MDVDPGLERSQRNRESQRGAETGSSKGEIEFHEDNHFGSSCKEFKGISFLGSAFPVLPHRLDSERPPGRPTTDALSGFVLQQLHWDEGGGAGNLLADHSGVRKRPQ